MSLRGFDVSATLVLIDGRRIAPNPSGTGNGGGAFYDLNTIPLPAIQSIEVLKDGGSATYGADAVAGVLNIKFWKDYRGAQVTLDYGNTLDKDAGLYSGDVLFGTGDDKVSVNGDIFFYHHNSMFNRDRGNSLVPPFLSTNTIPWNMNVSRYTWLQSTGDLAASPADATCPNCNATNDPQFFTKVVNPSTGKKVRVLNAAGLALVAMPRPISPIAMMRPICSRYRTLANSLASVPKIREDRGVALHLLTLFRTICFLRVHLTAPMGTIR